MGVNEEGQAPESVETAPSGNAPEPAEAKPAATGMPVTFETEHIAAGSGQVPDAFQTEIVEKIET